MNAVHDTDTATGFQVDEAKLNALFDTSEDEERARVIRAVDVKKIYIKGNQETRALQQKRHCGPA